VKKLVLINKAILKKKMLIAWPMFLPQWNDYIDKSHIAREIWWPQDTLVTNQSMAIMKFSCISETASGFNLS